jgi:hypothetical protein
MRQTSGVILNNGTFINSSHVVKIEKTQTQSLYEDSSDSDSDPNIVIEYTITIYLTDCATPVNIIFNNENDCDVIFNKIIMEMDGHNYAILNFDTK